MLKSFGFNSLAFGLFAFCTVATTQAQSAPVPFLSEPLVPGSVAPGGPALTLTVHGTSFTSASVVNWNGVALQTTYVSSSQLKATVPATKTAQATTASITVSTSGGVASNVEFFPISKPTIPAFTSYHIAVPPLQDTSGLQSPVVADVNGDGKLDLVGGFLNQMAVLLGNGDGSFRSPSFSPLLGGTDSTIQATAVVTGDFNADGKPDFAFGFDSFNSNSLVVVLGNGDGTFGVPVTITLAANDVTNYLYTADVNGDGKLDLISGNNVSTPAGGSADGTFAVFLGNGDGTFLSPVTYQVGNSSFLGSMAVGDFNNDGKLDVLATATGTDLLFLGNGDGTFASPTSSQNVGSGEQWVAADLNGDGNLDVLALESGQAGGVNTYLGNGSGTFTSAGSYGVGVTYPLSVTVADINVDGNLDAILPSGSLPPNAIGILLGKGDGTFGQPTTYPTESSAPFGGVAADFNGDGMPDLFFGSDTASVVGLGFVLLQGSFPELTSAPASITFAQQQIGTTSATQSVTLTNAGEAALAISKIAISGANASDYAETNTCGATLAISDTCQVSITFSPTAQGTRTASVSITDNAPGSPHAISLSGQTTPAPALTLSASSLTFPGQYVGTSGLPQTITVTNSGNATSTISAVSASPTDFGVLNACGGSLAAGASCSIGVFFDPTASGARSGALTITDDAAGSPQSVTLSGSGEDFSISASSSSASVSPGQTATYSVGLSGVGGFNQSVLLSCSGAPAGSTCSVSAPSVTLSGSTTSVTVSVTTVAPSLSKGRSAAVSALPKKPILYFSFCVFPGLPLILRTRKRTRKAFKLFLALVFFATVTAALNGCGGGSGGTGGQGSGGTPASTYTLTVTGTFASSGANLSHSTGLTLTVQ